jgi:hypothetical protein
MLVKVAVQMNCPRTRPISPESFTSPPPSCPGAMTYRAAKAAKLTIIEAALRSSGVVLCEVAASTQKRGRSAGQAGMIRAFGRRRTVRSVMTRKTRRW